MYYFYDMFIQNMKASTIAVPPMWQIVMMTSADLTVYVNDVSAHCWYPLQMKG